MLWVVLLLVCPYVGVALSKSISSSPKQQVVDLYLNDSCTDNGVRKNITENKLYRLEYSEELPPKNCTLIFEAEAVGACTGVCYLFVPNAFIMKGRDAVQLEIKSGNVSQTYNSGNPIRIGPQCTVDGRITLTFNLSKNYTFILRNRTFHLTLDIYNKCGEKGKVKSIKYEEAIKFLTGYDQAQQRTNFIQGILVGFGIASVFLMIFVIACFYIRTHEHGRTPNKNVGKGPSEKIMLKSMTAGQRK